jgi:KRAB domain-containing zinc finger protein
MDSFEDYHSKKIFECGFCSMRMDSREELQEHFKTHKSEKIICTHCKAKIPNFTAYRKHLMYHSKLSDSITCSECNDILNGIEALKFHMRLKHGCKLTCAHCEEQFAYVATLKSHIRRHIESQKYFCDSCNIYFPQMQSFRHHMQFVHRDPKCKICGKIISDTRKLRDHEKRHITEKEGLCPYCGKVLKTRNALKIHLMQHTGQYKYKCTICNRGITTRHAFNEHMNRHSSTPKLLYTCDKCGKQFNHAGTFSLHRKWHDNPYPYTCEYCGLKIRHTSLLRNHIRKEHTGEKPHECPHCLKRFLTKGQLRKHLPQHTGIFEFNCIDCNKGWVKKEYYNNHRHKVHGDPLPKRIIRNKADYKLVIPDDGPPPPIPIIEDSSDDNMNNMAHEIQQAIEYL